MRGFSGVFVARAAAFLIHFLMMILVISRLGEGAYGRLAFFWASSALAANAFVPGGAMFIARETAERIAKREEKKLILLVFCHLGVLSVISIGMLTLSNILGIVVAQKYVLSITMLSFLLIVQGVLQGCNKVVYSQVVPNILVPAVLMILLWHGYDTDVTRLFLAALAASSVVAAWASVSSIVPLFKRCSKTTTLTKENIKEWIRSGGRVLSANGATVASAYVPVWVAGTLFGEVAAGFSDVLLKFGAAVSLPLAAWGALALPRISSCSARHEEVPPENIYAYVLPATAISVVILAVGLAVMSFFLVGNYMEVRDAWMYLGGYGLAHVISVGMGPLMMTMILLGAEKKVAMIKLFGVAFLVLWGGGAKWMGGESFFFLGLALLVIVEKTLAWSFLSRRMKNVGGEE